MRQLLLIFTLITLSAGSASAQKIKVRKVKGNTAIVESNSPLSPGAVYDLISQDQFGDEMGMATRDHFVGMSFGFSNTKSDAQNATNESSMSLDMRFGWNLATFEVGPLVQFSMNHANDITSTAWKLGGFADYNLVPNITGEAFLYGLTAWGAFGNIDRGNGTKVDVVDAFGGLVVKWFPTSSSACFRFDLGYMYERQTVTGGFYANTGFTGTAGIFAYY
ncbi:hypothetical protein [Bdellovibrio sp. HCB274]|uniref:hypothetical protein n=1 Tax=Bdellovibrio sp. HCB274 TaxID=3394361 RepID=UPI0039B46F7A